MRILIAEDDERLADAIARGLRQKLFAVDVVHDGARALVEAAVTPYDALILDVMLPRATGFEVARELRARGARVPILMLTARDAVSDRVTGLNAGADDYLVKPFAFEELVARIQALLRRGNALKPAVLVVGDLEIDTLALTASRCGQRIDLTSREYVLLEYFARNAGVTLSRADITAHVWDDNHEPSSNALEVLVGRLRRKVEPPSGEARIETRRGLGYTLVVPATPAPSPAPARPLRQD